MLLLEHLDNLAESSAKAISNIKFDKVVVWEGGGNGKDGRSSTADWLSGMSKTLPPMMQVLKDIGGVELPEALIRYSEEGPESLAKTESNGSVATAEKPDDDEEEA
ncbi:hypothetical protein Enr8_47550 [Blastopirellula retiformator]|uniref:Flotillin C-terminal domain-containing protein n=2 Tax=Blastopirellula retiformator TaxID=2527970 RepID=A0A5C5UVA5_9BACT|nr:hypothetical protein Enr8_47550 [Blastopirellula retiformator]